MAIKPPVIGAARYKILEKLCRAVSVSGDENEIRKIVIDEVKPFADEIKVDPLGNVLVTRNGRTRNRVRILLDAHMDEVGFILVADDGDGIFEFKAVGGIDVRNLAGKQVVVGKDHKPGVVGAKPIHLAKAEELRQAISIDSLRVDFGPGAKAKVGERGTFRPNFLRSGPSIMSKALDNRLGVATLIELVKSSPSNVDLFAAFTVQEEIGLRGAKVAAQYFNPDLAIVIDSTPANDLPMQRDGENTFYNTRLGYGPAIYLANPSTLDDPRLIRFLTATAEKCKIPFQFRQPGGGGTNAAAIQRAISGIPVVSVSVPHRYTHTAVSIARVDDWKNSLSLLFEALKGLKPNLLQRSKFS